MKKLNFNDDVKRRYYVRRDDCGDERGDEYIALQGQKALGNGGLDHIYLVGPNKLGLWMTSATIKSTIRRLQNIVPDLRLEQFGDGEAVLSAPLSQLDTLCRAAKARMRPHYSEEALSRKRKAARHARKFLDPDREASRGSKIDERKVKRLDGGRNAK